MGKPSQRGNLNAAWNASESAGDDAATKQGEAKKGTRKNTSDLHRLLKIITLLQSSAGWTVAKLASEFGVKDRTIFRDIKKLQGCGIPIESTRGRGGVGGYQIQKEFFLQPVQLTPEEALALTALAESVAAKDQIAFLKPAHRAVAKIRAQLPEDVIESVETVRPAVVIHTAASSAGDDYEDVYDKVQQAIKSQRVLECEYESAGKGGEGAAPFHFEPYALFFGIRAWYAVGKHSRHKEVRTLKLSRFGRVKATEQKYSIPAAFSMDEHLGNAWGMVKGKVSFDVVVEFSGPMQETVAETRWHKTQETQFDDGVTRMMFTVDGLDEIVWWVLGMGPGCRVVKPAVLAERVKELALATAAQYELDEKKVRGSKLKAKAGR
ncbi:MAG: YafY family transcriptional regulator [Planctomycetes bacterium]|nr:YafY family transcriptional regulator [Planctomycetota bacterium]